MKLGNLQALPWYLRLTIFGGIAIMIYAGFWYMVTSGKRAETKAINDQVAGLLQQNAQAQIAYNSRQQEYDDLKALLPEQRELTSVLQGVQDRARNSRLSLRRFTPKDDIQQDFYSGKPVEVQVTSTFANLREFFDQIARYQRIVSITDFKIMQITDQGPGKTIDSQFLVTAYYASAETLQKAAPTTAKGKKTPAAPKK
jgi:Tfp pilus assembly protein PilO